MTCHDIKNQTKEKKDLKWWQLSLIGIGCTIGTGFFLGSSIGIKIGGSSIILILILTGFTTYIVFEALAKMTVKDPQKGSFRIYSRKAFGNWAGFSHGWTYWCSELLIMGSQLSALGIFSRYWFPKIPLWIFAAIYGIAAILIIFIGIKIFERLEKWMAIIKITAIIGLVLVQKLYGSCNESSKLGHTDTSTLKKDVISMEKQNLFKWKHYQPELILLTVRWYLRYNLSFRNLMEMMEERGVSIAHTTIMRWVHQYGPQLEEKVRYHLKSTNDSWRVDETYIKVKGQWMYLYRAVDSEGNTIDFYLSKSRDKQAAKRFFKKALAFSYVSKPRVITVDKNPAYPVAIRALKEEKHMPEGIELRQVRYLNNIVEQDHRFIKKRVRSMLGFKSFGTATSILAGVEAMHMIKKEQIDLRDQSVQNQKEFIHRLFGLTA